MRGRAWRRDIKDLRTIRRIKKHLRRHWWGFKTANYVRVSDPSLTDYIKTETEFNCKTLSTTKYDSRDKTKYSPNKKHGYYRLGQTRENEKINFRKILKENGII